MLIVHFPQARRLRRDNVNIAMDCFTAKRLPASTTRNLRRCSEVNADKHVLEFRNLQCSSRIFPHLECNSRRSSRLRPVSPEVRAVSSNVLQLD
jgi:hypothetical protein